MIRTWAPRHLPRFQGEARGIKVRMTPTTRPRTARMRCFLRSSICSPKLIVGMVCSSENRSSSRGLAMDTLHPARGWEKRFRGRAAGSAAETQERTASPETGLNERIHPSPRGDGSNRWGVSLLDDSRCQRSLPGHRVAVLARVGGQLGDVSLQVEDCRADLGCKARRFERVDQVKARPTETWD